MPPAQPRSHSTGSTADLDPDWDWDWASRRKLPDTGLITHPCPDDPYAGSPHASSPYSDDSSPGNGQSSGCDLVEPPAPDPPPF